MKGSRGIVRISTLGYALLTLLAREPLSGYDLAQRMKRPLGFFWQAQHSQIYPELAGLEEHGCMLNVWSSMSRFYPISNGRVEVNHTPMNRALEITLRYA